MKNEMYKHKCLGFTLAELLIVVAIIAILVAVSVPIFANKTKHAKEVVCENNRKTLVHQIWYEKMGDDSFTKAQAEQLIKDSDAYCPTLGSDVDYTLEAFDEFIVAVTCPEHGFTSNGGGDVTTTTGQKFLNEFQEFITEYGKNNSWLGNDKIRTAFYEKYSNKWPTLTVDGKDLSIQPFYKEKSSATDLENRVWLFAREKTDSSSGWNASYIYNIIDKKWYKKVSGSYTINNFDSVTAIDDQIKNGGIDDYKKEIKWEEVIDYKEEW